MRVAFIANGELSPSEPLLARIHACDAIVAVDGGINHCLRLGIIPEFVIGDLDSASEEALAHFPHVKKHVYPRDKDQTDLEIALHQYSHADRLDIFAGLGHRTDHTLFNIHLLARYPGKASLISNTEEMFVIDRQTRLNGSCIRPPSINISWASLMSR
jgi:thiamine pyrophosphokinase